MGRRQRIDIEGGWYHVMNRGVDHQPTFFSDLDRVDFGRQLATGCDRFGVEVHAYCLMPNHFHLVLYCPQAGLSAFMHDVAGTYVRHVNDRTGRDGPLFKGRFHSVPIRDDHHLLHAVRYIHRNPLDLAAVGTVDGYRWSSHRTYLGAKRRPDWMRIDRVLSFFDDDVPRFHRFVGGDGPRRDMEVDLDATTLAAIVPMITDATDLEIRGRAARSILIAAIDGLPEPRRVQLLDGLGLGPAARRTALSRARADTAGDPRIAAAAAAVRRLAA